MLWYSTNISLSLIIFLSFFPSFCIILSIPLSLRLCLALSLLSLSSLHTLFLCLPVCPTGQMCKLRERVQELRSQRECEQHKHSVAMTELRVKLHEERQREVAAAREALARQHEAELARLARVREAEVQRLQAQVNALREGGGVNSEVCRLST